jgi:sigma-B regulation protein RsbU (phosphoserine phosphatase)
MLGISEPLEASCFVRFVSAMPQDNLKILLIEHDTGFARRIGQLLGEVRDLTADVRSAPNLQAGLSALSHNNFDVVMLDVSVPDGAGLANVSVIKDKAPRLPIIVAGDADNETVALEAVHAGAQDYLVKSQLNPGWLERSIRYSIERHRMDEALLAAEAKYHGLFDHLVEGIFQTTPEGRYLLANAALARIYGYSSPEELMQSITNIATRLYAQPGRRDEFIRQMQEHDTITGFESEIFRKDGSTIWISENCRAIRDAEGRLLYFEGTVEDITQRREAEAKLRDSEWLYHSLVETLPQNIFRKDLQERFTFANTQFCKTLGRTLEEIRGKTDFDFFPPELAAQYQLDDRKVMESGKPHAGVEEHQPPGQEKIYVQVVKTPLYSADGRIIGLQGIFWDITEKRRAEEQLAKSQQELRDKNQQLEEELKMASDIQVALLPQRFPTFPRAASLKDSEFQFTHRYLPTGTVGGDFFTVSPLSDTEAGVFICDVAGHGVRSALVTAIIRALVEELKPVARDPAEFLTKLNRELFKIVEHSGTPVLTTAFYLVADCRTGQMRYANAGHPKPLHLRRENGQVVQLVNASGQSQQALAFVQKTRYHVSEAKLSPGDMVLLFTDGLYDQQGAGDAIYTQANVADAVRQRATLPASQLLDQILDEIRKFSVSGAFADDVCVIAMEYRPAGLESRL